MIQVIKKDGSLEDFNAVKIIKAVQAAAQQVEEGVAHNILAHRVVDYVKAILIDHDVVKTSVTAIHTLVENGLMTLGAFDVARSYISYRKDHQPDVFRERKAFKPFEYPHLYEFVEAIQNSYWTHRHFSYTSDIQDFKVHLSAHEQTVSTRAMLAIGQIEVAVKTFWGNIGNTLKKPEIQAVGATFSESEVRHADAYVNLLELLGLNEMFKEIDGIEVLKNRRDYLSKNLGNTESKEEFVLKLLLFSVFVENVSLFSQFLIMLSFDKEKSQLKGLANAIQATSKEEDIHFQFGVELIKIIQKEYPEVFTEELIEKVKSEAVEALKAEEAIIEWMFDGKDLPFLKIADVKAFIWKRMRSSLAEVGIDFPIYPHMELLGNYDWFDQERVLPTNIDFFAKSSTDYSKHNRTYTEEELF